MFDRSHECFPQPPGNLTLWRYIDFTKLLSMLEDEQLLLARVDQFDDPYEGSLSRAGVNLLRGSAAFPAEAIDRFISATASMRQKMFMSCWVASDHESAAMWKLYLQSPEGVSIKSDFESLATALDQSQFSARATMVKYVDYETTPLPFGNMFFPFLHKRLSFAHENELRVVVWADEHENQPLIGADAKHIGIAVEPNAIVRAIHVSPTAPMWFGRLVEQVVRRYGLRSPVIRSGLYDRPSY
jgi:hypothetical protein